jgi:hypothetical protein
VARRRLAHASHFLHVAFKARILPALLQVVFRVKGHTKVCSTSMAALTSEQMPLQIPAHANVCNLVVHVPFVFAPIFPFQFEKIISAFCQKKSVDPAQVRFVFDGNRINAQSTPDDEGMVEGDTIDAFLEQIGGGSSSSAAAC